MVGLKIISWILMGQLTHSPQNKTAHYLLFAKKEMIKITLFSKIIEQHRKSRNVSVT